jgi:hypothetical protein
MNPLLDNIAWHTLAGPHAKYATGTDRIRRYAAGFSPIVGFADLERPDLDGLTPYCESGDHFCAGQLADRTGLDHVQDGVGGIDARR